jgi:serine/threonine protein kinase
MKFYNYVVERELGRGAMGVVYLAHDEQLGRRVAIKTLQVGNGFSEAEQASLRERLYREAKAAARLTHPHIITIFQIGEEGGTPFIAMEFVDGMTLEAALQPGSGMGGPALLRGLRQAAEALDYAHRNGLVHRDVKPANILISRDGVFKVADFGIVKVMDDAARTETAGTMGTPSYLSPEQVRGERVSGLTDQYALAVTAYRLIAGRLPFQGASVAAMFYQILQAEPEDVRVFHPELPGGVNAVLRRGMAKRPEERYPSCEKFIDALQNALYAPARPQAQDGTGNGRFVSPLAAVVFFVVTVGVGLGGLWWWTRPGPVVPVIQLPPENFGRKEEPRRTTIDVVEPVQPPKREETPSETFPVEIPPAGASQRGAKDGLPYVWVPAGKFQMGCSTRELCSSDESAHAVMLRKGFWMAATEVTAGAYKRYVKAIGGKMPEGASGREDWKDDAMPISNVNHTDAASFCAWGGGRLPTEAEWEYAARAGTKGELYGRMEKVAWIYQEDLMVYLKLHDGKYPPVGTKEPNRFRLFDMIGSVSEWVSDYYDADYFRRSPAVDPQGPERGDGFVHRGGSLLTIPNEVGVARRRWADPRTASPDIGFRCVGGMAPL